MKFLPIIAAIVLLALTAASAAVAKEKTAPCFLTQAKTAAQARIQATCVAAKAPFRERARGRGWRIRVPSNSCSHVKYILPPLYRCRFSGAIGSTACHGAARIQGYSRTPAKLRRLVTYFRCRS